MGKTTISSYLETVYQLPVLDADVYAREAVEPDSKVLKEVVERYGSQVLLANGHLDRRRLGDIIFSSQPERIWLEQRIHPFVRDRFQTRLTELATQAEPVVVVIPLLFEARMTDLVTEIWVVHCPKDQQISRLMERDQLNSDQAQVRIASQMPIEEKIRRADVILDNSSTPEALLRQVDLALSSPDYLRNITQ